MGLCTMACSALSGGSLLQRVSFHTWAPSASALTSPFSTRCEVNPSRSGSWSLCTKLLGGSDFQRDCLSPCNPRKFFGRGVKVAAKPLAGCAVTRTCNVTCGAKHHRTYINTMKNVCSREKERPCEKMTTEETSFFAQTLDEAERQSDIDLLLQSFARPRVQFLA